MARVAGENIRWYYEASRDELIHTGNTFQIQDVDFFNGARFFVTQTVNDQESPPAVISTNLIQPLDVTIDSLGTVLHAVPNGENEVLPDSYLFEWYLNDALLPNENSEWLYPEGNGGWYSVTITNLAGNCVKSEPLFVEFSTDTEEPILIQTLKLYPNPAKELFYLEFGNPGSRYVQLFNASGALLRQLKSSDQVVEMSTVGLPSGLYFVRCIFENGQFTTKKVLVND